MNRVQIAILWLGALLALGGGAAFQALAQTDNDGWVTPVNISQAGSAVEPVLAVDAAGEFHVVWQDPMIGFLYSQGDGRTWSESLPLRAPFTEPPFYLPGAEGFAGLYTPHLVIDSGDLIHGFWINEEGILLYSAAPLATIADATSWTFPIALAESAAALDVLIDGDGRFHLAYIRPQQTTQFPAGVYYRQSDSGGAAWSDAISPYQSQYLSVPAELAHIAVTAAGENVFLGWDDRLLDSVFVAGSNDGGASWADPAAIDRRTAEDDPNTTGPSHIDVALIGETVHLTWRAEHATDRCSQFHQWSRNLGATWQPAPTAVGETSLGCPTAGRIIAASDGLLFLLTTFSEGAFLQAWNDGGWSEPVLQPPLVEFTNPKTYRPVGLGCLQTTVTSNNRLFVIGCGQGHDFDVWSLTRPLGVLDDWSTRFLPTPVWNLPQMAAESPIEFMSPEIVAGGDGRLHAFWSQPDDNASTGQASQTGNAIYYSRLNAGQWSPARPVITSPAGKTDQPAVFADANGNLFVVWSGGDSGQIYFSRAVADRASSVTEWIVPQSLTSPRETSLRDGNSWPDIVLDDEGMIYVAYAIPLNEDRGIYLTQSSDGGDTWADPVRVFDGVAAGWQMVGPPRLALTTSGSLHLIWARHTLPGGSGPLALVYARSVDGGQNWSTPETAAEQGAAWSQLVAIGERSLHRAWLAEFDDRLTLSYQHSIDDGLTWSAPDRVFTPDVVGGPPALISAPDGPHLLQLARNAVDDQYLLLEWLWDGVRWRSTEGLDLGQGILAANEMTAVIAPDGRFGVIYAALFLNETNQLQNSLYYIERRWDAPAGVATPLPTLMPTPTPLPTQTPLPPPSPTPTRAFSNYSEEAGGFAVGPLSVDDDMGGIIISVIPAVLLVVIVFVVGLRARRR